MNFRDSLPRPGCFACWTLVSVLMGGCAAKMAQPDTHAEAQALVHAGDAAYARMDFETAWKAYRKAETLGVRDGILSYRLDVLGTTLKKPAEEKALSPQRKETLGLLNKSYREGNNSPAVYFYLAQALEEANGNGSKQARLYAEAVGKFEAGGFQKLTDGDLEKLGRMYRFLNLSGQAEKLFLRAQQTNPSNAFAAYGLGKLYQQVSRHRAAMTQFERFVGLAPRDVEGHILLGESALAAGEYARASKAFETALALDSNSPAARRGMRHAQEALQRGSAIKKGEKTLVWEVGFKSQLRALTLPEDSLRLSEEGLGPPALGQGGDVVFASGGGGRFDLYTLSSDGMNLVRRAVSSSGFTASIGDEDHLMVTVDFGSRRKVGTFDLKRGTYKSFHQGDCRQPDYLKKHRSLLCAGPGGVFLVNPATGNTSTILREPLARHPRLGGNGQTVVLAERDEVAWFDRTGRELGRHRFPGKEAAASYPALSPDGRWIVSGDGGLHLTSVRQKMSIALDHPELIGARRAAFAPQGEAVVFVKEGRLYWLELPRELESFFAFQRVRELIRGEKFGAAARLLKSRPPAERGRLVFHLLLGEVLMGIKVYEEAEASLRRAEEMDAGDWRPPFLLGKLKASQENWSEAIRNLDRAVLLAPRRFEGYMVRAKVRTSQGRIEDAVPDYRSALQWIENASQSETDAAVLGLLDVYVRRRRLEEALLLVLDQAENLSARALDTIRTAPRFKHLQGDSRFRELLGFPEVATFGEPRKDPMLRSSLEGPAAFMPYRARIFIDNNPSPVESEVIAEDANEVTIRAFGVIQKYPRERLRIIR